MGGAELDESVRPTCYYPRRFNVVLLSFVAITLTYMLRSNLSIAILVMSTEFDWKLSFKGLFLSSFFWGYITTQVIGGMAARRIGPKNMMLFAIIGPSICTMFIPLVAPRSEVLFVACRVLSGATAGATFPTMYLMLSRWTPFSEKAISLSIVSSGVNIGTIITDTIAPSVMKHLGWQWVFFLTGGPGFIWMIFWYFMTTDTPADMKNIHPYERKYIQDNENEEKMPLLKNEQQTISASVSASYMSIQNEGNNGADEQGGADKKVVRAEEANKDNIAAVISNKEAYAILFRSTSFWNVVWCGFCLNWASYIFLTWLPTYVHSELGFSVQAAGIIAIAPNISNSIISFFASKLCDYLLVRGYNKLKLRRIFFSLGCLLYIITLSLLALRQTLGISPVNTAIILALGTGTSGLHLPGYTACIYDIAPYHSSLVVGISNTAGTIPGIVGVFLTGVLLQMGLGWSTIFFMVAGFFGAAMISFLLFMDVKRIL